MSTTEYIKNPDFLIKKLKEWATIQPDKVFALLKADSSTRLLSDIAMEREKWRLL